MLLTFIAALVLVSLVSYHVGLVVQHRRVVNAVAGAIAETVDSFVGIVLTKLEEAGLDESTPGLTQAIYEMIEEAEQKFPNS